MPRGTSPRSSLESAEHGGGSPSAVPIVESSDAGEPARPSRISFLCVRVSHVCMRFYVGAVGPPLHSVSPSGWPELCSLYPACTHPVMLQRSRIAPSLALAFAPSHSSRGLWCVDGAGHDG